MSKFNEFSYIAPNLRKRMTKAEKNWATAFHSASQGYRNMLTKIDIQEPELSNAIKEIGQTENLRRRDIMTRAPLTPYIPELHSFSDSIDYEDILIDAIDSNDNQKAILSSVDTSPIDVGSKVIVRAQNHLYSNQSGIIVSKRRSEFLVQITSKKVPVHKGGDKDAPALMYVSRDELKVIK